MCKTYEPKDFENYYVDFLQTMKSKARYIDPDSRIDVGNTSFYKDLSEFLNSREKEFYFESNFTYYPPACGGGVEKEHYPGVELDDYKIVVYKDDQKQFRLTSDQFGFSASEKIFIDNDERYPLVKLNNISDDECTRNFIVKYIEDTRSKGSSFFWPLLKDGKRICSYNKDRGIRSYIEDRVDLTLLEIKHVYDKKEHKSDKLYNAYINKKECIDEWLDHFETFKNYIDYFMLNPFVVKKEDKYYPIDIINSTIKGREDNDSCVDELNSQISFIETTDYKKEIQGLEDIEKLKKMLTNVRLLTLARSRMMEAFMDEKNWEEFDPKWEV